MMSIGGMYHFMNGKHNYATLWLALSGCARSNGVLNAGYVCYHAMQQLYKAFSSRNRSYVSPYPKISAVDGKIFNLHVYVVHSLLHLEVLAY